MKIEEYENMKPVEQKTENTKIKTENTAEQK